MTEVESAHGKLAPVDVKWTGPRFVALLLGSLTVALIVIYVIASIGNDWGWHPFAHDLVEHTFRSSSLR
jgi:hypothetical protein